MITEYSVFEIKFWRTKFRFHLLKGTSFHEKFNKFSYCLRIFSQILRAEFSASAKYRPPYFLKYGAHPASYPMGTESSFAGGEVDKV